VTDLLRCLGLALPALWLVFLGIFVAGVRTIYVFQGLAAFSALVFALDWKSGAIWRRLVALARKYATKRVVAALIGATVLSMIAALIFDLESLHGTLWDLGQYISAVRSMALTGRPEFNFHGNETTNYFNVHSTISVYFLGWLYRVFHSGWVLLVWQGFFLCSPGLVAVFWYRAIARRNGLKPEPLGDFLAFMTYASTPIFLGQIFWPFTFHIASVGLFAAAYLFYFERRWLPWAVMLLLLPLEKEDFGLVSETFALLVIAESLFSRSRRDRVGALVAGVAVAAFAMGYSVYYSTHFMHAVPFVNRFGHLGASSPFELAKTFLLRPLVVIKTLGRPLSLKYIWFFFAVSMLWLTPRWSALRFFVPVAPLVFINCIAQEGSMQLFRTHYALMPAVGLSATLVLGVWNTLLGVKKKRDPVRLYAVFAVSALIPLLWNHQTTFASFKEAFFLWRERAPERAILAPLRANPDVVVCCEDKLCTSLIERPLLLDYPVCSKGSKHLKGYEGKSAVFVTYTWHPPEFPTHENAAQPYVDQPRAWVASTPLLRLSEPVPVSPANSPAGSTSFRARAK
jgi:hypothetical protein